VHHKVGSGDAHGRDSPIEHATRIFRVNSLEWDNTGGWQPDGATGWVTPRRRSRRHMWDGAYAGPILEHNRPEGIKSTACPASTRQN
jgi:hypothetical protein